MSMTGTSGSSTKFRCMVLWPAMNGEKPTSSPPTHAAAVWVVCRPIHSRAVHAVVAGPSRASRFQVATGPSAAVTG